MATACTSSTDISPARTSGSKTCTAAWYRRHAPSPSSAPSANSSAIFSTSTRSSRSSRSHLFATAAGMSDERSAPSSRGPSTRAPPLHRPATREPDSWRAVNGAHDLSQRPYECARPCATLRFRRREVTSARVGAPVDPDELVGAAEVAARLGLASTSVIHDWRRRHADFPEPVRVLSMGVIWTWPEIERWARATGRLQSGSTR